MNPAAAPTEAAADRVRREVIAACRDTRDPDTGTPLFADAFSVADRSGLDPTAEGLPDVLAPSADGYQAQAKWSPFDRTWIRPEWDLPATHYADGILAIDAPDLCPGGRLAAALHDVAPTALALLGLDVPESMEGRVLNEAFDNLLPVRLGAGPSVTATDPDEVDTAPVAAGFGAVE